MKTKTNKSFLKFISLTVVQVFLLQQVATAAPILVQPIIPSSVFSFDIPQSLAEVEDMHYAGPGRKQLILMQDAHTNQSGQINLSKTLELILKQEDIRYVFTEAGSGDVSLSMVKPLAGQKIRENVSMSFLKKGLMHGSEHLNVTGDQDFVLWGVENRSLYRKAVSLYKEVADQRPEIKGYLSKIKNTADMLKFRIYDRNLIQFDETRNGYLSDEISLTDYLKKIAKYTKISKLSMKDFPNLRFLNKLSTLESRIDFDRASLEQQLAIESLPESDREYLLELMESESHVPSGMRFMSEDGKKGFYGLLEEKIKDHKKKYPNLFAYFDYMKQSRDLDAASVLLELKAFDYAIYDGLAKTEDERLLIQVYENWRALHDLVEFKVTPEDFEILKLRNAEQRLAILTGFLNKAIIDIGSQYDYAIEYSESYQEMIDKAMTFYDLTLSRDIAFVNNALSKMNAEGLKKAVLVTGGFHTENLKVLLENLGVSYVTVRPQVFHETNHSRYEDLLFSTLEREEELPLLEGAILSSGSSSTAMTDSLVQNRPLANRFFALLGLDGIMGSRLAGRQVSAAEGERFEDAVKHMPLDLLGESIAPLRKQEAKTNALWRVDIDPDYINTLSISEQAKTLVGLPQRIEDSLTVAGQSDVDEELVEMIAFVYQAAYLRNLNDEDRARVYKELTGREYSDRPDVDIAADVEHNVVDYIAALGDLEIKDQVAGLVARVKAIYGFDETKENEYIDNLTRFIESRDNAVENARAIRVAVEIMEQEGNKRVNRASNNFFNETFVLDVLSGHRAAAVVDYLSQEDAEEVQKVLRKMRLMQQNHFQLVQLNDGSWYFYNEQIMGQRAREVANAQPRYEAAVTEIGMEFEIRRDMQRREGIFYEYAQAESEMPLEFASFVNKSASGVMQTPGGYFATPDQTDGTEGSTTHPIFRAGNLAKSVFSLQRLKTQTTYMASINRPDAFRYAMEVEIEGYRIFNRPVKRIQVYDASHAENIAKYQEAIDYLEANYDIVFEHATWPDRIAEQGYDVFHAASQHQAALDAGTMNPLVRTIFEENNIIVDIDGEPTIDAAAMGRFFNQSIFQHISGVRNYFLLHTTGETIMHFDDDAPALTFYLRDEDPALEELNRERQEAYERVFASLVADINNHITEYNQQNEDQLELIPTTSSEVDAEEDDALKLAIEPPADTTPSVNVVDAELLAVQEAAVYAFFADYPSAMYQIEGLRNRYYGYNSQDPDVGLIPQALGQITTAEQMDQPIGTGNQPITKALRMNTWMDPAPVRLVNSPVWLSGKRLKLEDGTIGVVPTDVMGASKHLDRPIRESGWAVRTGDTRGLTNTTYSAKEEAVMEEKILKYIAYMFLGDFDTQGFAQFQRWLQMDYKTTVDLQHLDQSFMAVDRTRPFGSLTNVIFNRALISNLVTMITFGADLRLEEPPFVALVVSLALNHQAAMAIAPTGGSQERNIGNRLYRISRQDFTEVIAGIARSYYTKGMERFEEIVGEETDPYKRLIILGQALTDVSEEIALTEEEKGTIVAEQQYRAIAMAELAAQFNDAADEAELEAMQTVFMWYAHDFHLYHATDIQRDLNPNDPNEDYFYQVSLNNGNLEWQAVSPNVDTDYDETQDKTIAKSIDWTDIEGKSGTEEVSSLQPNAEGLIEIKANDGRTIILNDDILGKLRSSSEPMVAVAINDTGRDEFVEIAEQKIKSQLGLDGRSFALWPELVGAAQDLKTVYHMPGQQNPEAETSGVEALEAVQRVVEQVTDSSFKSGDSASWGEVLEMDPADTIPALRRALGHRNWKVRVAAIEALDKIGTFAADAAIAEAFDPEFRDAALRALNVTSAERDRFQTDQDENVRNAAEPGILRYRQALQPTVETPTVETPTVETPTVETPTVETPTVETPTVETPTVETPTVETPTVETPTVETPTVETPTVETPTVETPTVETPTVETPTVETPTVETPTVETPTVETPTVETPTVETPTVETPTVETPTVETPTVETPTVETPTVETPTVETPTVETPTVETPTPVLTGLDGEITADINVVVGGNGSIIERSFLVGGDYDNSEIVSRLVSLALLHQDPKVRTYGIETLELIDGEEALRAIARRFDPEFGGVTDPDPTVHTLATPLIRRYRTEYPQTNLLVTPDNPFPTSPVASQSLPPVPVESLTEPGAQDLRFPNVDEIPGTQEPVLSDEENDAVSEELGGIDLNSLVDTSLSDDDPTGSRLAISPRTARNIQALSTGAYASDVAKEHILSLITAESWDELRVFTEQMVQRRNNMERFRNVVTPEEPFNGYDVYIIGSTSKAEALEKQELIDSFFGNIPDGQARPIVLSVGIEEASTAGQVAGVSGAMMRLAEAAFAELPIEVRDNVSDLKTYMNGRKTVMIPDAGMATRFEPLTQGLAMARGRQLLTGQIKAGEESYDLELMLAVLLQASDIGANQAAVSRTDVFWTTQLAFGTVEHASIERGKSPFEKFVVTLNPDAVNAKDVYDFGTAILDEEGNMLKFYGNHRFAFFDEDAGRYRTVNEFSPEDLNKAYKGVKSDEEAEILINEFNELLDHARKGGAIGYDFGSFSMVNDMLFALEEHADTFQLFGGKDKKRDIDPDVVKPVVAIMAGVAIAPESLDGIASAKDLQVEPGTSISEGVNRRIEAAKVFLSQVPEETRQRLGVTLEDLNQPDATTVKVLEAAAFYLTNRDNTNIFAENPKEARFGTASLGDNALWITYRRPLDILNERLSMLADLTGEVSEVTIAGEVEVREATIWDKVKAEDLRRIRGIKDDAIAVFRVHDDQGLSKEYRLTKSQVQAGISVQGISIKNAIIQGDTILVPGYGGVRGTVIENSVIQHTVGQINASHAYVENTVANVRVTNSLAHNLVTSDDIEALEGEVVTDAFHEAFTDGDGRTSLRASIGHSSDDSDKTRTVDGKHSFARVGEIVAPDGMQTAIRDNHANAAKDSILTVPGARAATPGNWETLAQSILVGDYVPTATQLEHIEGFVRFIKPDQKYAVRWDAQSLTIFEIREGKGNEYIATIDSANNNAPGESFTYPASDFKQEITLEGKEGFQRLIGVLEIAQAYQNGRKNAASQLESIPGYRTANRNLTFSHLIPVGKLFDFDSFGTEEELEVAFQLLYRDLLWLLRHGQQGDTGVRHTFYLDMTGAPDGLAQEYWRTKASLHDYFVVDAEATYEDSIVVDWQVNAEEGELTARDGAQISLNFTPHSVDHLQIWSEAIGTGLSVFYEAVSTESDTETAKQEFSVATVADVPNSIQYAMDSFEEGVFETPEAVFAAIQKGLYLPTQVFKIQKINWRQFLQGARAAMEIMTFA